MADSTKYYDHAFGVWTVHASVYDAIRLAAAEAAQLATERAAKWHEGFAHTQELVGDLERAAWHNRAAEAIREQTHG